MSEGDTSGYGGAPGRAKGIKVMVADSSFCIRMLTFPYQNPFFPTTFHTDRKSKRNCQDFASWKKQDAYLNDPTLYSEI